MRSPAVRVRHAAEADFHLPAQSTVEGGCSSAGRMEGYAVEIRQAAGRQGGTVGRCPRFQPRNSLDCSGDCKTAYTKLTVQHSVLRTASYAVPSGGRNFGQRKIWKLSAFSLPSHAVARDFQRVNLICLYWMASNQVTEGNQSGRAFFNLRREKSMSPGLRHARRCQTKRAGKAELPASVLNLPPLDPMTKSKHDMRSTLANGVAPRGLPR
ncbi:hypothetical protein AXG93_2852s1220 [Marchantia polymorpha subsp. ruderalis]|uniref:Uncharacterized protein n=1 Tax=Marchantia polymorpha subsp. ruderalis TaxID=1480154 RepID=A0A176WL98_MARPO|nr:hypothetical protein AXG93_2852s1220 [Marchantia polymorpha subsp. ruderalis]